jgi:hypothetical protein
VKVYAGTDPVSGKRHDLTEIIKPRPKAEREAQKALTRLLNQLDEQRNPRTRATVNQLMTRYLEMIDIEETTRAAFESYLHLSVGRVDPEVLDSFYLQLRTCRAHCRGRKFIEHRTERPMALVTALWAARLAAGLPVAYWSHDQVDRQVIAADVLLSSLDPADTTDRIAAA